jgi:cell division protein FtsN
LLVVVIIAVVAIIAALAYSTFARKPAPAPVNRQTAIPVPPVDSLAMVPLPYVVAIEAYTELKTAEDRQQMLSDSERWIHFFVAPLVRENVPYYHVFAGPLRDSAQAAAALDTLLAHKVKTGAIPGDLRQVPLSFLIDRFPSQGDALARVAELKKTAIPTFIVSGDVNGVTQWRVYAGAYSGPAEADVMRALLKGAGIKDSLITRTGRSNQ